MRSEGEVRSAQRPKQERKISGFVGELTAKLFGDKQSRTETSGEIVGTRKESVNDSKEDGSARKRSEDTTRGAGRRSGNASGRAKPRNNDTQGKGRNPAEGETKAPVSNDIGKAVRASGRSRNGRGRGNAQGRQGKAASYSGDETVGTIDILTSVQTREIKPKKGKLMIIPLGGLGEIGKNMTVFQYEDDIVVLDSGLAFPEEDMLGIDIVIPDMSYLTENRDKIRAVVITHAHEDHIGSLAYLMKEINAPVYATNLACGLIEGKFKEHRVSPKCLRVSKPGDVIKAGVFKVGFIQSNHSIPDSCAIYFETPIGLLVHTGDFKIDQNPIDGKLMDMQKLAELGKRGVTVLMSDSTNVERPGFTPSESTVRPALMRAVAEAKGRVILATFASNVSRLQQAVDAAVAYKRKVVVQGRSMVNVSAIAAERGYLNIPEGTMIDIDEMKRYREDEIMILTTGSQGEPMAGLSRMAGNNHRMISIVPNDTIILSASPIPGNEGAVGRTIDNLMRLGATVIYGKEKGIHVSGHASQEELKIMLNMIRPKYFIPVHGEYRMLKKHAELAISMGVDPKHVLVGDNGQIFEFTTRSGRLGGRVNAGNVFVDGSGVGDVGNIVIRDRQQLANEGMVIVSMAMERDTGNIVGGPNIVSRGFVYVRDAEDLMNGAERRVLNILEKCEAERIKDWSTIKNNVRDGLGKYLFDKTKRRPMILPIILDV